MIQQSPCEVLRIFFNTVGYFSFYVNLSQFSALTKDTIFTLAMQTSEGATES